MMKRILFALCACSLLPFYGLNTATSADATDDTHEGDNLILVNRSSGKMLNAVGNANGSNASIANNSSRANQRWSITAVGNGEYSIRSMQDGNRAIDVWNANTANGANLALYGYWGGESQRFTIEEVGGGFVQISPVLAADKCVDAFGASAGSNVGIWSCWGGQNQQWDIQSTEVADFPAHEETAERVYGTEGKITYSLYLKGVEPGLAAYIANSMKNAVAHYNVNGDFTKHVVANYHVGVPTAQAGWDGKITFGSQRNTRTAIHELSHTVGVGTHSAYWDLMTDGTWDGPRANAVLSEFDGPGSVLTGNIGHILKYGANHNGPENNPTHLYRHVKIVEAMRCDMGIGPCYDYEGDNITIVNRASGLVLDVTANTNGGNVLVRRDSGSASQKWTVTSAGLGDISFRNSQDGRRAIDTWNRGQVNGTNMALYGSYGGDTQRFLVEEVAPGWYTFKPRIALGQCIDAFGTSSGDNVGTWACHGGYNQQWRFED